MSMPNRKSSLEVSPTSPGRSRPGERSFTLIETLIALGLMVFLVMEIGGVHGNALYFNRYGRQVTQGVWLAKRLMSQVEYQWTIRPFKEMETANEKERPFEDFPDYSYSLEIKEWKLPILDLVTGGALGGGDEGEKKKPEGGGDDMMKSAMKNVFGDSILKTAHVEVFWAEGAKRNSVGITYLLTNQEKLDELLTTLKATDAGGGTPSPSGTPNPSGTPAAGGSPTPVPSVTP